MANKKISKIFFDQTVANTEFNERAIPVVSFSTAWMDVRDYNGEWEIGVHRENTNGNVSWTVEQTYNEDRTDPLDYSNQAKNKSIPNGVKDNQLLPPFIRITFTITGNPTGWLTAFLARINRATR